LILAIRGRARAAALAALLAGTGLAAGAAGAPPAFASSVLVIEDFAPMRMVPSASAPRKAYAPLGLLLKTRRVSSGGDFVEGTNGESRPFEAPAWLHYWVRPSSVLFEPGQTKIALDLVVHQKAPGAEDARADFPGRRFSVAEFLADSTALPDSYHVAAGPADDPSPWGGEARLITPKAEWYDPPGVPARKAALRAAERYQLYVVLAGPKPIRSVRERIAIARILVKEPSCGDFDYVETEVLGVVERTRAMGDRGSTVAVPIPAIELTTTESAAQVLWSRIVYSAALTYEDGTAEMIGRRLLVRWPLCP
jgi:hypothetical protein